MTDEVEVYQPSVPDTLRPDDLVRQVTLIQEVMGQVMKSGEHYGTIPGCGDKPALLKPGAEKLAMTFQLAAAIDVDERDMGGGHREYYVECRMSSTTTGIYRGMGVGSCSTMESKYRYRKAERVCPECEEPAVIKGQEKFGGGWLCYKKKGGCGAKWGDDSPEAAAFEVQIVGKVEYPDPADYYNTCLKMAKKRAMVDAVLTVTAASDIFAQDIEDLPEHERKAQPKAEGNAQAQAQSAPKGTVTSEECAHLLKDTGLTRPAATTLLKNLCHKNRWAEATTADLLMIRGHMLTTEKPDEDAGAEEAQAEAETSEDAPEIPF